MTAYSPRNCTCGHGYACHAPNHRTRQKGRCWFGWHRTIDADKRCHCKQYERAEVSA